MAPGGRVVVCPRCGRGFNTLSGLRGHVDVIHAALGQRQRSLLRDEARRIAGWEVFKP
jgi:uncharacterized C2H2 Zn-finger protein